MSLGHHLRAEQNRAVGFGEAAECGGEELGLRGRVGVEPDQLELGKLAGELPLELLCPRAETRHFGEPQLGQVSGDGSP